MNLMSLFTSDLIELPKDIGLYNMRMNNEKVSERMTIENRIVEEEGDDKSKIVLRISISSTLGKLIILVHLIFSLISSYQSTIVIGLGVVYSSSIYYQLIQTNNKLLKEESEFLRSRLEDLNEATDTLKNKMTILNENIYLLESQIDILS